MKRRRDATVTHAPAAAEKLGTTKLQPQTIKATFKKNWLSPCICSQLRRHVCVCVCARAALYVLGNMAFRSQLGRFSDIKLD